MKKTILLLFTLLSSLCLLGAAAAEDTHFTCSSAVSDFDGKTFEDLYLDVDGCGASLEFTDLTVTGNLIYDGGRDTEDHYITFIRPSIESMYAPCEPTHTCHFIFNPKDHDVVNEYSYVVNEMTLLPSGNEKGKIFVCGKGKTELKKTWSGYDYALESASTVIDRLNYIIGSFSQETLVSLRQTENVPALTTDFSYLQGDPEIHLQNIIIEEMSVVNLAEGTRSSVSMSDRSEVNLLAAYTPSLALYEKEKSHKYRSEVYAFITALDGNKMELSLDHVWVDVAHVLGNNNTASVFDLKTGYEIMHDSDMEAITNLFLFGSNMSFSGYKKPDRDTANLVRLVVTEQPDEYEIKPSSDLLNKFLCRFGDSKNYIKGEYLDYNEYERILDEDLVLQRPSIRMLTNLSQQYAVNYPKSEKHWKPTIKLSYVNVGKAVCAQSIAEEVPALNMFHINTDSYMYMTKDVMRYVMPEGLTESLADEPRIYTGIDLLEGCHTYGFDQYGNIVVKD